MVCVCEGAEGLGVCVYVSLNRLAFPREGPASCIFCSHPVLRSSVIMICLVESVNKIGGERISSVRVTSCPFPSLSC